MTETTEIEVGGQTVEVTVDGDSATAEVKETPFDRFMNELEKVAENFSIKAHVTDTRGHGSQHHSGVILLPHSTNMRSKDTAEIIADVDVSHISTVDESTAAFNVSDAPYDEYCYPMIAFFVSFDAEKYE